MTEREKVKAGLECLTHVNFAIYKTECQERNCPYKDAEQCDSDVMVDALNLLEKSFTPNEVYDAVVQHAQHDTRFKLGDKIDYSFSDVVDILNTELMCRAGDM